MTSSTYVGTTAVALNRASANLSLTGIPSITGGSSTTQSLTLKTTSGVGTTGADMHFLVGNNGGTEAMTILNSGNIGIGTTAPSSKLDIAQSSASTALSVTQSGTGAIVSFTNTATATATAFTSTNLGSGNSLVINDEAGDTTPFVIDASGNVGIGIITPTSKLDIFQNSTSTALTIAQNGTGDILNITDTGISIFKVGQATVEITRPLDLQVEGDVGIEYNLEFMNTSTSYIHSAGPFVISAGDSNSYENLTLTTSGTGDVIVDVASSVLGFKIIGASGQVFSIDPNGNVIIGGVGSGSGDLTVKGDISTQGGNLTLNSLATPSGVAVTPVGTAGSTTRGYRVSAINGNGETLASTTVTTATSNATLTTTDYNRITWSAVTGATGYKIYGRTSGSELYMATVDSPSLSYSDTGTVTTPAGALPTANTTGGNISYPNSGGPARSLILTPNGATIPTVNGASQVKVDGANHTYYVLDFDDSADEGAYWHWTMPDSYDGGTIDVTYYWETTATTGDTVWCFQTVGIEPNNSEDIDAALGTAICETDTAQVNANDLASVTENMAASGFVAGDYVAFKVYRDADDGLDTLTGDARLVKIKVEYHVSSESD